MIALYIHTIVSDTYSFKINVPFGSEWKDVKREIAGRYHRVEDICLLRGGRELRDDISVDQSSTTDNLQCKIYCLTRTHSTGSLFLTRKDGRANFTSVSQVSLGATIDHFLRKLGDPCSTSTYSGAMIDGIYARSSCCIGDALLAAATLKHTAVTPPISLPCFESSWQIPRYASKLRKTPASKVSWGIVSHRGLKRSRGRRVCEEMPLAPRT